MVLYPPIFFQEGVDVVIDRFRQLEQTHGVCGNDLSHRLDKDLTPRLGNELLLPSHHPFGYFLLDFLERVNLPLICCMSWASLGIVHNHS